MELNLSDFLKGDFIPEGIRVICVAGGSGSGKSFVAGKIAEKIGARLLGVDDYIISEKIIKGANWDLPECWNLNLLREHLGFFLEGKEFVKPIYNFGNSDSSSEVFVPGGVIVVEGVYALCDSISGFSDFSIFVDSPEDVRLRRRIKRDSVERSNHGEDRIVRQWNETIQPTFLKCVEQQRAKSDLIIIN